MKCKNCGFNVYPNTWVHGMENKNCSRAYPDYSKEILSKKKGGKE